MLALGIRYLNGFVVAASPDSLVSTSTRNMRRVEWPPHPGRVFMALAAAHFATGDDPAEREALIWLEEVERDGEPVAPHIYAPEMHDRTAVEHFVPVNDQAGPSKSQLQSAPVTRDKQPRTFAHGWLEEDTVFMVWPEATPMEPVREALQAVCGKVSRIGHSSSLVHMWVASEGEAPSPNWLPNDERASLQLRVASRGTLDYLRMCYNAGEIDEFGELQALFAAASGAKEKADAQRALRVRFPDGEPRQLRPTLSVYQGYAPTTEDRVEPTGTHSWFDPRITVFRLEPEQAPLRYLDLSNVLSVAHRWRQALISLSNEASSLVREVLSGHTAQGQPLQRPHLAFVPLAFINGRHADGHLLGMAIVLPTSLTPADRRAVLRVVGQVRQLRLGQLGVWNLLEIGESPPRSLEAVTWTAYPWGATHWATVTPIVFDSHPKAKGQAEYQAEVGAMIKQGCTRIGLPAPREVVVTSISTHSGVPPASDVPLLLQKDGTSRRQTHAIIVFDEPVIGPLLLGAGRYRGYGFCCPVTWPDVRGTLV